MNRVEQAFFDAFRTVLPVVTDPETGRTFHPFMTVLPVYHFHDGTMKLEIIYKEVKK